ncbi:MAG TPA: hypothetical protein VE981_15300 [Planctomycetota bacterium]|nr:hypothetical protein [Planctomycetota bacterium]
MDAPDEAGKEVEIEEREGFIEARFTGTFALERFKRQAEAASEACLKKKMAKLLVDISRFSPNLSITDRYELAVHAVRVSKGLKVALVATETFVDPNKFGIMVARNRGLLVDVFTDRRKAVDWLLVTP